MSEYTGGPLDVLADLFMKALRADKPEEKKILIDKWNEAVKQVSTLIKGR